MMMGNARQVDTSLPSISHHLDEALLSTECSSSILELGSHSHPDSSIYVQTGL